MEGMNRPHQVRNQQSQNQPQGDSVAHQGGHGPVYDSPAGPERKWYHPTMESKITLILVMVASVIILIALAGGAFSNGSSTSTMNLVKSDQYQAVFLSNGQVYFGQITGASKDTMILEDIFYLQVDQQLQPDTEQATDPQVSLAKLGNELHGPEDQMFISMQDVVFWENLRDDGDVVQAIAQYNENGEEEAQAPVDEAPQVPEEVTEEE